MIECISLFEAKIFVDEVLHRHGGGMPPEDKEIWEKRAGYFEEIPEFFLNFIHVPTLRKGLPDFEYIKLLAEGFRKLKRKSPEIDLKNLLSESERSMLTAPSPPKATETTRRPEKDHALK